MGFREGLLRARGQIAFLVALVCSTGVIIYLEMLDAEGRIRDQVTASLVTSGQDALSPDLKGIAETTVDRARQDFAIDPQATANRAAVLNGTVLGIAQGVGSAAQHRVDAEKVLDLLESEPREQTDAVAPALALQAAAIPAYEPRVSALLARE